MNVTRSLLKVQNTFLNKNDLNQSTTPFQWFSRKLNYLQITFKVLLNLFSRSYVPLRVSQDDELAFIVTFIHNDDIVTSYYSLLIFIFITIQGIFIFFGDSFTPLSYLIIYLDANYIFTRFNIKPLSTLKSELRFLSCFNHLENRRLIWLKRMLVLMVFSGQFTVFVTVLLYSPLIPDFTECYSTLKYFNEPEQLIIILICGPFWIYYTLTSSLGVSILSVFIIKELTDIQRTLNEITKNLETCDMNILDDHKMQINLQENLRACIKRNLKMRKFQMNFNALANWMILILSISGIAVFITSLLQLYMDRRFSSVVRSLGNVLSSVMVCAPFVFFGQQLKEEYNNVYQAIQDFPWYLLNMRNKRTYMIFLNMGQKELGLSFFGLVNVDYRLAKEIYSRTYAITSCVINRHVQNSNK